MPSFPHFLVAGLMISILGCVFFILISNGSIHPFPFLSSLLCVSYTMKCLRFILLTNTHHQISIIGVAVVVMDENRSFTLFIFEET